MKTSRKEKDPLLPPELWVLVIIGVIALIAGLMLNPVLAIMNWFHPHH
ncbi:MAG: hypothetical protein LV481_08070 [Methylacidiphilales bacterium]|nr:hypothetical protein [Candidatus Methylacidiphilales bacterium]